VSAAGVRKFYGPLIQGLEASHVKAASSLENKRSSVVRSYLEPWSGGP